MAKQRKDGPADRQLNLFGDPPRQSGQSGVGAVEPPAQLAALAAALPDRIRMGTSSWSFPGWRGLVYGRPATQAQLARRGLEAYARHPLLRAVGIDRTFYAPIASDAFAEYAAVVGEDFRFLVKASSQCSSPRLRKSAGRSAGANPLFLDPVYATDVVVGPYLEGLGHKAGTLVFQFPPVGRAIASDPQRFAEDLGNFLAGLPRAARYAVELRDRELLCPAYFEILRELGACHCLSLHPRMPAVREQQALLGDRPAGPLIVRWMLRGDLIYDEARRRYQPFSRIVDEDLPTRDALAELAVEHSLAGWDVMIIVNNKAEGSAPLSVFKLAERIASRLSQDP